MKARVLQARTTVKQFLEPRVAFALIGALYLLAFPYHPGLRSPNELCRLWQTRALVDHGKISLNETIREYGMVGDLSRREGLFYPSKAPALSFFAVPIYWVLKQSYAPRPVPEVAQVYWSRLFITVAPTLFLLWLLRRFLTGRLADGTRDAGLVVYALGSLAFSYSELFMSHQTTAVLLFSGFYAAVQTRAKRWPAWGWAVAGLLAALSVVTEYTAALTVLAVALWAVVDLWVGERGDAKRRNVELGKTVGLVVLGAAPALGLLMLYHQAAFGHPLESGYKFLNDAGYQGWHVGGFLGIRGPDLRAFGLSFFSPLRGLFALSPWVAVALAGIWLLRKETSHFVFLAALSLGNAYFTSAFTYDSWGWCIGPRHLTPWLPFLVWPLGKAIDHLKELREVDGRALYGVVVGACASSVLVAGVLSLLNYVPDSMSTAFFGLAVPLLEAGYYAPSALSLLGVAQPAAGLPLYLLLGAGLLWVVATLRGASVQAPGAVTRAALAALVVHLWILSAATRHDAGDVGSVEHLKKNWLTPPPSG
jgi:hypothetical protein